LRDKIENRHAETTLKKMITNSKSIVFFDGICNFCDASVNFVIDRDPQKTFQFASLQSDFGQAFLKENNRATEDFDSIILWQNGRIFDKSDAALEISKKLSGGWPVFYLFKILPKSFRDFFYDMIAKNRYVLFGKMDACRLPTPEMKERFV
jgi:predicted DCC family thiol-disulfide oxidoreductase YuxK